MMRTACWVWAVLGLAAACGDDDVTVDDAGAPVDAGLDAGEADAGRDAGPGFDAGPPITGCELLEGELPPWPTEGDFAPPAPDAFDPIAGPGGPSVSFEESALFTACAHLDGGERDRDHHNTVLMLDGYVWLPFAHEGGVGGIRAFDLSSPCEPTVIGTAFDEQMRETHAAGVAYANDRRWMAVTSLTGIQFWDITDPTAMRMASDLTLPDVTYPNSYLRVVMSLFWQAPYVYVSAATLGVFVVDASDPENPELVAHHVPSPAVEAGNLHALGTRLVLLPSEGIQNHVFDISNPTELRPVPGGAFLVSDGTTRGGRPNVLTSYFGHVHGTQALYARHLFGGGLVIFDLSDWSAPQFLGQWVSTRDGANGGYVFVQNETAFVGLSSHAAIVDVSDPTTPTLVQELELQGDFDTLVPVGNVLVGSVDDDAIEDQASAVFPWQREPDTRGPAVNRVMPEAGADAVALGARVGLAFDEHVELETLHPGSFYVRPVDDEDRPLAPPLTGHYSGQEGLYNFAPDAPLRPGTRYEVVVPAGGVRDWSGNPTTTVFRSTFVTARCE
ncbi:MAG: Ig-like domain-containing protein [Sandaracinus sp.]|nr:Ig-like domain-containing protein [Sandaracinus sp.]